MRIIRDDAEALIWQNKSFLRPLAVVPVLFVAVIVLGAFIQTLTHVPASLVFVLLILGGVGLLFYRVPTCVTFVFARESRRFMVMRQYLLRQTREEFEFNEVNFVQLKPGQHGTNTLRIVLDSGKKIFVECYHRGRLKPMARGYGFVVRDFGAAGAGVSQDSWRACAVVVSTDNGVAGRKERVEGRG